jgi:hypothetical protein
METGLPYGTAVQPWTDVRILSPLNDAGEILIWQNTGSGCRSRVTFRPRPIARRWSALFLRLSYPYQCFNREFAHVISPGIVRRRVAIAGIAPMDLTTRALRGDESRRRVALRRATRIVLKTSETATTPRWIMRINPFHAHLSTPQVAGDSRATATMPTATSAIGISCDSRTMAMAFPEDGPWAGIRGHAAAVCGSVPDVGHVDADAAGSRDVAGVTHVQRHREQTVPLEVRCRSRLPGFCR